DLVGVPWTDALTLVLRPFGLRWVRSGDRRIEVRREDDARYLRLGLGIKPPICVDRVDPVYPDEARKARIQGIVIIEAHIDETGVVQDAVVLKPLPYGLGEAAIDAVKQWRFRPALRDGQPVPVVFNLTVNFKLDVGKQAPEP
ncbi:MAG: energy transducer TonB, partial [Thermoanaerobaculia bacterium]